MIAKPFFVDGAPQRGADTPQEVLDPATGAAIATIHVGTHEDAARACDAAGRSQPRWAQVSPREKSEVLRRCFELVRDDDELASLITAEHGKPSADARAEVAYAAEFFRWNSEEAVRIDGTVMAAPSGAHRILVRHPPVGVVVIVTPWNFPAAMITRKVAPALAAGNAVVIKPALETPLTALRLAEIFVEAGVPPGLVSVIPTIDPSGWFDAAVDHPATRMVSFTGSTQVGQVLLRRCADRVLKVGMELGGNAPFIVFDDADVDAAVEAAMTAKMRHSAETCTAANRFFVHRRIESEFTEAFADAMSALVAGPGSNPLSTCGPLITNAARTRINGLVQAATSKGAVVATGGHDIDRPGYFFAPTVLTGVAHGDSVTTDEIFGPVAPVVLFDDEADVISMANDTEAGLAGYVFSSDLGRAMRVGEQLQAGMVGINRGALSDPAAPFGGMKQSGLGREGGTHGILEFCETQYLAVDW